MSARRLFLALALIGACVAAAILSGGCSPLKKTLVPNEPPHTVLFVSGTLDTVNHTVHLHWLGTAAHGYIAGYELRVLNPLAPADTAWHFTVRTDSIFTIYTPTGYAAPVVQVRAIDDQGVRDPHPASQAFQFSNQPPVVKLVGKPNRADLSDTTYASVTVTWTVEDPDGSTDNVTCRAWLNGRQDHPQLATGTSFTMPSSEFRSAGGLFLSGRRTLYLQGVDDGGMPGPIDSVTWYVKAPVTGPRARVLLIDDVPTTLGPTNVRVDSLYANALATAGITTSQYSVLRPQFTQPFRSAKDLEQTFKQFEAVIWYRGENNLYSRILDSYAIGRNGEGIGPYLDAGGKCFIESLNMVTAWSSHGPLTQAFIQRYLNCTSTFQYAAPPDSSGAWGMATSGILPCPAIADSIQNQRNLSGVQGFAARDPAQILILAPVNVLTQHNPIPMPIAMSVPQANGGLFILDTYPMVSGSIPTGGFPQRASVVLLKILGLMGLNLP